MPGKPALIVMGFMGQSPFAGVAWQALHYLEGFRRLGYDVYYLEDTGSWPFDPEQDAVTSRSLYTVRYLARLIEGPAVRNRRAGNRHGPARNGGHQWMSHRQGLAGDRSGRQDISAEHRAHLAIPPLHFQQPVVQLANLFVFRVQPGDLTGQGRNPGGGPHDGSVQGCSQKNEKQDRASGEQPGAKQPLGNPVRAGVHVTITMDHDRHVTPAPGHTPN
ncbi:MAG: hypothetical protein HYT99_04410, partial [Candidatus Tectomicrobia bacterium]|nr:hypothetical protein [Candidatus Tectomicrobia bacterium]